MKHLPPFLFIFVLLPFLAGCAGEEIYAITLITGDQLSISSGDMLRSDVILTDGNLSLQENATLTGNLFILGGTAELAGTLDGNVVLLIGDLDLQDSAVITKDLSVSGGTLTRTEDAQILGKFEREIPLSQGASEQTPSLWNRTAWFILQALTFSLLSYLFVRYRPKPVRRIQNIYHQHILVALALGTLGFLVFPTLLLLMVFTLVLIPLALLLALLMLFVILFGWIAIGLSLGEWINARFRLHLSPQHAVIIGAVLIVSILSLLSLNPFLELLTFGVLSLISLGAMLLTRFGFQKFVPPVDTAPEQEFSL